MDKIPFNITSEVKEKKAFIRITGEIGWDTDAEMLRPIVDTAIQEGATSAHLYLFGPGGSCFQATEMVNILSAFNGNLTGEGGALVASAYTYIAQHCTSFVMPANGMFMVHKTTGFTWGKVEDIEAYLKMMKSIENDYFNTFLEKAKNPDLFKTNWEKGDWWMTASEAYEQGFITGVKDKVVPDDKVKAMLSAFGCPQNMIPILNKNNMTEDYKPIAKVLDLDDNASIDVIVKAITKLKSSLAEANTSLTGMTGERDSMKTKLDEIEKARKEEQKAEAEKLLTAAFKDGRLDNDADGKAKTAWLAIFDKDYEGTASMLASLPARKPVSQRKPAEDNPEDGFHARQKEIEEKNKRK